MKSKIERLQDKIAKRKGKITKPVDRHKNTSFGNTVQRTI